MTHIVDAQWNFPELTSEIFNSLFFLREARKCSQQEIEQWKRERQGNPNTLLFSNHPLYSDWILTKTLQEGWWRCPAPDHDIILCMDRDWFWDLALAVQPHGLTGRCIVRAAPPVLPCEAPELNISQIPKSASVTMIKDDFGPEMIHIAPSWSFPSNSPCSAPHALPPLCNASLSRKIYYRAVNTILPLRKKIKIRNTLQEDAVEKAKS